MNPSATQSAHEEHKVNVCPQIGLSTPSKPAQQIAAKSEDSSATRYPSSEGQLSNKASEDDAFDDSDDELFANIQVLFIIPPAVKCLTSNNFQISYHEP
jgi:uncharacterized protein YbbK (DUF523 family)